MSKQDDRLEDKLIALEEGVQPENAKDGSSNSSELKSLVSLATSIRDLPHPELDQQTIRSDKRRLISAAREKNRTSRNSKATKSNGFTGLWLFAPAVAGVALIVLMAFVLSAGAGLYFSGPRGAQAAVLTDAAGVLEVSDTGLAGDWRLVSNGDELRSGQRLRTRDESWVTLEFFDGTNVTLNPNTDLVLSKVSGDWGKVLQVEFIQNDGETYHQVVPLQGDRSTYQVFTPTGEASVRGTSFRVFVEETGMSRFIVETGEVLVNNEGLETFVSAGESVVTELGVPIASAHYNFTLSGDITSQDGKTWVVAGVSFLVTDDTQVDGDPGLGDFVEVQGRIKKKGDWLADSIDIITQIDPLPIPGGTFTGFVTEQSGNIWTIGGFDLQVQVDQSLVGIGVGDLVRVRFHVADPFWIADSIELVNGESDDDDSDADQDDDSDSDMDDQQGLVFVPEKIEKSACDSIPSPTFDLLYHSDSQDAISVELGYEILDGGKYLIENNGVQFDPLGPYVIYPYDPNDPIDPIPFVTVTVNFFLKDGATALPQDGEIEIRVYPIVEPGIVGLEMEDLEIELKCEGDKDEDAPTVKEGHYCTSTDLHPKALELEGKGYYNADGVLMQVEYSQIMDWFCNFRYGFGEIDLMLGLSYNNKVDILYVFGLREAGKGWGQIKRQLVVEEALDDELSVEETKKEPPGKQKSEDAKNKKEKPNKKDKGDD